MRLTRDGSDTPLPGYSTGEFDHHEPAFVADPWPTYAAMRAQSPVEHSDRHGGFWVVSRYDDIVDVAERWQEFTSTGPGLLIPPGTSKTYPFLPLEMDPPDHTAYRRMVADRFAPRAVRALSTSVEGWAKTLLEPVFAAGRTDIAQDFAANMSAGALAIFIGLPSDDRSLWLNFVMRSFEGSVNNPEDARAALGEFSAYLDRLIAQRVNSPTDDLISSLLASEVDSRTLTDDEIRGFLLLLLIAGHETTASTISHMFWQLATHPEQVAALRADPAGAPRAVEEYLRLASPVSIFSRHATRDVDLQGCPVAKGDVVGLSFASANRDETHFDNPDDFSLSRGANRHLAFGWGIHTCLGAPLARLEIAASLRLFLDSGLTIHLDGEPEFKSRGDALSLRHLPVRFEG